MAMVNDWQIGKELKDRLYYMLQNQLMCDVTLLVGNDQVAIKAHKFMMASASPVFYSMFDGPMAEKGDVKIPDIEPTLFHDILKFIYTDHIEINAENVSGLIYGAEKYNLQNIKEECSQYLMSNIDEEHAWLVLQTAFDFNIEDMMNRALDYILKNGSTILQSPFLFSVTSSCLELVVGSDKFLCKEEDLFEKLVDWSKHRCKCNDLPDTDENVRKMLGKLLYLIRFPIMDRKYFTEKVSQHQYLLLDEIVKIYQSYDGLPISIFQSKLRFARCNVQTSGILFFEDDEVDWNLS